MLVDLRKPLSVFGLVTLLATLARAESPAAMGRQSPPRRATPSIEIGSPDLLRNDATVTVNPLTPTKPTIFTGLISGCSADPSISLDKGDPANCASSIEGEGANTPTNGSSDADDFYIRNFTPAGSFRTDPDSGLLTDTTRPFIEYQIENACDANSVLMVKNRAQGSVDIYLGNATACPTGACCDGAGNCTDGRLEFECTAAGDIFQGDGSTCASSPCIQATGACCTAAGCLDNQTQAACTAAGGTYQGDGSICTPATCPASTGACCTSTACLDAQTQASCTALGGTFQGTGTTCAANPCPTDGACCTPTGCLDAQTPAACTAAGGTPQGNGTTCASNPCPASGACCTSTACLNAQTQAACTAAGGTYQGNNTNCTANPCTGACCRPGTGCVPNQTAAACQASGGNYQGNLTVCGPTSCGQVGACCSAAQPCRDGLSQAACTANGGTYGGDTTTCIGSPCTGACCSSTQPCANSQTPTACQTAGGTYQGDTSTCGTANCAGACCIGGVGCVDGLTGTSCQAQGGTYQGDLTNCVANPCPGACCNPAGDCADGVLETACVAAGNIFHGEASDCTNNPCVGACCSPTFACAPLTATDCGNRVGANVWLGVDTVCGVAQCPVTGACCGVFGCGQEYSNTCFGTYLGDGTICTPNACAGTETGACCDDVNDTCTDGTLNSCNAAGGRFVDGDVCGANTCDIGACCSLQFPCQDGLSPEGCGDLVGNRVFLGDGTTCADPCPPTGACCGPFGCTLAYQAACAGTYLGDGTTCTPNVCAGAQTGACCDDAGGSCAERTQNDCNALGLRFVTGTLCTPDACFLGACCHPTFPCVDNISPAACDNLSGARVFMGDASTCAGGCPPTGACCLLFGCNLSYSNTCSGTYMGDGTTCGGVVCP